MSGGTIAAIRVEGTQRIEPSTVLSYLVVKVGDPFDAARVDESLKSLFATGLFADATLSRDGNTLVVKVVENPIINRIAFEGNRHIDDDQLQKEVQLRPRVVYTRTRVQSDVQRILDLYRRNGRFAATVDPKVIQLDQNRVDLVFEINEGPRTGVRSINFVGDEQFSASRLRQVIQTKESAWWRFLSSDDTYDPDRLNLDKELLRRFYLSRGYADFRVISAVAELTPDRTDFIITFTVEEGDRYKVGKIDVKTNLRALDPETLRSRVTTVEGDWYDAQEVESTITNLTTAVGNLQYAFVDVEPQVTRHREDHTIDITYQINEGPRVFVERIDISGNVRTLDKVIRREMLFAEGDPFNATKLRRSEQQIHDLGFFEKVSVTQEEGSQPDRTVVKVDVAEQSTGEISIGAGYSTSDGPLGDFSIRERNLLGRGQDLGFSTTISARTQQFNLSFTEPHFLDRDMSAGVDLFHIERDNTKYSSYKEADTGGSLRLGYPLTEHLRQTLNYTIQQTTISDVPTDASLFIQQQQGSRLTSLVGQQLLYDRRDSKLDPTSGYYLRYNSDVAGLGGNAYFLRNRFGAGYYYPIATPWVLAQTAEVGYIFGFGQNVAIEDRFFLGGDTFRGFQVAGIGPRDTVNGKDDALGGNLFERGTTELSFPLGLPEEFGITGHAFSDYGALHVVDGTSGVSGNTGALRLSVGSGISWRSPLGPIRVDFAVPILKQNFDKVQEFSFSFGTRF